MISGERQCPSALSLTEVPSFAIMLERRRISVAANVANSHQYNTSTSSKCAWSKVECAWIKVKCNWNLKMAPCSHIIWKQHVELLWLIYRKFIEAHNLWGPLHRVTDDSEGPRDVWRERERKWNNILSSFFSGRLSKLYFFWIVWTLWLL